MITIVLPEWFVWLLTVVVGIYLIDAVANVALHTLQMYYRKKANEIMNKHALFSAKIIVRDLLKRYYPHLTESEINEHLQSMDKYAEQEMSDASSVQKK